MEDNVVSITSKSSDEELLNTLIEYYENAEQSTDDSRTLSERDRDYVDHKQFTADEVEALKARKQPPIVVNRIKPKVDFLLGMERQTRSDPKAFPRTPQHEDAAEAATDAIRYVLDNNEFDYKRSDVFENMLVEGTGGVEILMKTTKRGPEVVINQYPWDRLFWDPHSRRRDFSDAKYKGAVVWMDLEDAKELGNKEVVEQALAESTDVDTYDDTPRIRWVDKSRERIKMCSIWFKQKGVWHWAMITSAGFVKPAIKSPFKDDDGNPECGMEMQSAFVDRDGNRYGIVRGLIDIQDEINKRRSKALHLLTMRQTMGEKGAVEDVGKAKREMAKPDGHVEVTPGMSFEVLNTNDLAQGQLALLQEAKGEIDAIGANAALQGKEERAMSGRALLARQQSGSMELGPIFDSLRSWQKRVYRQCWNRVRQYWTEERWIRVTDDENNLKWVGLNRPITAGEQIEQELGGPPPPELANDPRLQQQVGVENAVAELDVDIILEDTPDTITIQAEQFEMLVQMYQANPQRPDNPEGVPWKMVIEASQLRNKDKALGEDEDEEGEQDPEKMQMMQQLQQMNAAGEQLASEMEQMAQQLEQAKAGNEVKGVELKAKAAEGERRIAETKIKHQTTMEKAAADLEIARLNSSTKMAELNQANAVTDGERTAMQEAFAAAVQQNQEMNYNAAQQMAQMVEVVSRPKHKTVDMEVNGKRYHAEVNEDGSVMMSAGGEIYQGEIEND